jgi:SAM-dependent methyltransferase
MRAQRPRTAAPAIDARAEALPLDDDALDAAMACITIHHWEPPEAGLAELRRVARGPVVVFTFELDSLPAWQQELLREGLELERPRFPAIADVEAALGGRTRVERMPTPGDCVDGFFEAYWRRPEALLDPTVRAAQSMWALLPDDVEDQIVKRLRAALASGEWDAAHGHLRAMDSFDGALRLVISGQRQKLRGSRPSVFRAIQRSPARRASARRARSRSASAASTGATRCGDTRRA